MFRYFIIWLVMTYWAGFLGHYLSSRNKKDRKWWIFNLAAAFSVGMLTVGLFLKLNSLP